MKRYDVDYDYAESEEERIMRELREKARKRNIKIDEILEK